MKTTSGKEAPIPEEWSRDAYDAANAVSKLVSPVRERRDIHVDLASHDLMWSIAAPVIVGMRVAVANDAPQETAVGLDLDADPHGVRVIMPGDQMRIVGGTNGHVLWPPASRVFEVASGILAGERVQFILEPDPRPAGENSVIASAVLLRADESVLREPARLAALHRALAVCLATPGSQRARIRPTRYTEER